MSLVGPEAAFRCGAAIVGYEGHSCRAGRMLASVKRGGSLCSATPSMLGEIDKIGLVSPIAKQAFVGCFCPHTGCKLDKSSGVRGGQHTSRVGAVTPGEASWSLVHAQVHGGCSSILLLPLPPG